MEINNGKVTKSMQVLLVIAHYVLTVGKGENVRFTAGNISEKYGEKFVDWETDLSSIRDLVSSTFYKLKNDEKIKVVGQDGNEYFYMLNEDDSVNLFHKLMEDTKIMYDLESATESDTIILSNELQEALISYAADEIFEENEGHYTSIEGKDLIDFMAPFTK